jgi:hypothetical protein
VTEGRAEDVIVSRVGETTTAAVVEAVCAGLLLSVTVAVKVAVPLDVGMPVIAPVDGARVSPEGSLPDVIAQL